MGKFQMKRSNCGTDGRMDGPTKESGQLRKYRKEGKIPNEHQNGLWHRFAYFCASATSLYHGNKEGRVISTLAASHPDSCAEPPSQHETCRHIIPSRNKDRKKEEPGNEDRIDHARARCGSFLQNEM